METTGLVTGSVPSAAGRELLTLLFTDIVGSTELTVRMGDRRWRALLASHDKAIREKIASSGGRVITPTGDGFFATFERPSEAISCASEIVGAVSELNLNVRCGIHTGECEILADNVVGRAVHTAARICAAAEPLEILVSGAVRDVVAGSEVSLVDRGLRELRGIPGSYRLFGVSIAERDPGAADPASAPETVTKTAAPRPASAPAPSGSLSRPIAPPARLVAAETELIGRERELRELRAALEAAGTGNLHATLINGEPGIGKTALCAQLAADAAARGFSVLYGRCEEELQIPFGPFADALSQLVAGCDQELLATHVEDHGTVLSHLAPEISKHAAGAVRPPTADQYAIYSAAGALLAAASAEVPILLVLEDLHWADAGTLLLLRSLLSTPAEPALLCLCTCRSSELGADHPLEALMERFHREPGCSVIGLEGLEASELESLFDEPVQGLGDALAQETDGNPYFTLALLQSLAERGEARLAGGKWQIDADLGRAELAVPGGVRATIRNRIARLPEPTRDALHTAAVVGREFEVATLAGALGEETDVTLAALDPAFSAGLIAESDQGRIAFNHTLVAHALYEELPVGSRRRIHRTVADAIEAEAGTMGGARIGELARHLLAAAEPGREAEAFDAALTAGERALVASAANEAVRWFEAALALASEEGPLDRASRCDALIGLGSAQRAAGNPEFRETLLAAAHLALEIGESGLLVSAAIANTRGFASATGTVDDERVTVLEAALDAIDESRPADRARLLAILAAELTFSGDWERRLRLADEALETARAAGDTAALTEVLSARYITTWTPETLGEREANTAEELALAREHGTMSDRFRATHWRAAVAIERGELADAWAMVDEGARLAVRLGQPTALWLASYDRAVRALIQGRLPDAERWAREAGRIASDAGQPEAAAFTVGQLLNAAYEEGRMADLAEAISAQVEENPGIPGFRAALSLALCEAQLDDRAAETLAEDSANKFASFAYDSNWLVGLTIYAEVAGRLGATQAGAVLLELLEPWSDHVAFNSATAWGLVSRPLGVIEASLGKLDAAEARLTETMAAHERMGAPIWLARTRLDLAGVLLERRANRDLPRARDLLQRALATAEDLGCTGIRRRAADLLAESGEPS